MRPILVAALAGMLTLPVAASADESTPPVPTAAPGGCRWLTDRESVSFPFDLHHGDIRFEATINGHPTRLLLDDGFMWDALLLWGGAEVDSLGLAYDGKASVGGGDDSGLDSRTASGITVGWPGLELTDQKAVVTPSSSGTSLMWAGSIGQISAALFKHFVVAIDFDRMTITLTPPDRYETPSGFVEVPWRPLGSGARAIPATLELTDGRVVSLELMMDLGYNDQLRIATGREHRMATPDRALPASLGFDVEGNETRGHVGRLRAVRIGGIEIADPLVAYVSERDSARAHSEAMIGLGLLSRLNLVFDLRRQRLLVQPARSIARPFEYDMTGFDLSPGEQGLAIVSVHDGSPASAAGLEVGDTVLAVDGRPAAEWDFFDLMQLFRREGATLSLVVARRGHRREVTLTLRPLV